MGCMKRTQFLAEAKISTGSEAHPASYPVGIEDSFPIWKTARFGADHSPSELCEGFMNSTSSSPCIFEYGASELRNKFYLPLTFFKIHIHISLL
jgi:hypothetical protein